MIGVRVTMKYVKSKGAKLVWVISLDIYSTSHTTSTAAIMKTLPQQQRRCPQQRRHQHPRQRRQQSQQRQQPSIPL
jgi:hypothetical protein